VKKEADDEVDERKAATLREEITRKEGGKNKPPVLPHRGGGKGDFIPTPNLKGGGGLPGGEGEGRNA